MSQNGALFALINDFSRSIRPDQSDQMYVSTSARSNLLQRSESMVIRKSTIKRYQQIGIKFFGHI